MSKKETKSKKIKELLVTPAMVASIISIILTATIAGFIVPAINLMFSEESTIKAIIEQEAQLVFTGKFIQAISLFDDNAYVKDSAGGNVSEEVSWIGSQEIVKRYGELPEFTYLKHDAIQVIVSSDKTYARATADTIMIYKNNGVEIKKTSDQGEKWIFEKINGDWKISGFIYNLP